MAKMTLHFLNARGQLSSLEDWLFGSLNTGFVRASALLPLRDVDVVVKVSKRVVPEKGHVGYAPEAGLIYVTVDPGHPALCLNADQSLERMLAHELHHCCRWDGPGYGNILGAAVISEGLAGHFAQEAFGGQPEPWECLPANALRPHVAKAQDEWANTGYGHDVWFFGAGALPRWLGYSLGYQVVAQYLTAHRHVRASGLVHADTEVFLPHFREV